MQILVIEDDPDHRVLLWEALQEGEREIAVVFADNVSCAKEIVLQSNDGAFHCILSDFNLNGSTATDLIPQLREAGCDCPQIVISSSGDQSVVIDSMRCGGMDFLPKTEAFVGETLWKRIDVARNKWEQDEAERRRMDRRARHLAQLAETDHLTGLANRRSLDRLFTERRCIFDRRGYVSAIMLDVDHFKKINDTHGHPVGDEVLRWLAAKINDCISPEDLAVRYGGEEMVVIRPFVEEAKALDWTETLRGLIDRDSSSDEACPVHFTASLGVVTCRSDEFGRRSLDLADAAMYLAKTLGRNQVRTWRMAEVWACLRDLHNHERADPETALYALLELMKSSLGTIQRKHLREHSSAVARIAMALGRKLGLGEDCIEELRIAGLCHDLGKATVPEELLAKPTTLSFEERKLISRHSEEGALIAERLGLSKHASGYIRDHHTSFVDRGRLAESEDSDVQLLGGRILAVADAYQTMIAGRPYRPPRSHDFALKELRACAGRQFDPVIVGAMESLLPEHL